MGFNMADIACHNVAVPLEVVSITVYELEWDQELRLPELQRKTTDYQYKISHYIIIINFKVSFLAYTWLFA